MPSAAHEMLLQLFRDHPLFAARMLGDALHVPLPAFTEARLLPGDLTEVVPRELRADQLVVLHDREVPVMAIVLEAQLRPPDTAKRFAWPSYVVGAFARYRCPACLLVVTTDRRTAERSAQPITIGPRLILEPFVLGPEAVPRVTDPEQARASPELAVLSAMAHGHSSGGLAIVLAALVGVEELAEEQATLYTDMVASCLGPVARQALEEIMANGEYQIQSEFLLKLVEKGRREGEAKGEAKGELKGKAEGVLLVLEARGLVIPDEVRQRVTASTDLAELSRWLRRAAVASAASAIFDETS